MVRSAFGEFESEKAEKFFLDHLRQMTIEQRWRAVAEMRQIAVEMVRAAVRAEHADWTEQQTQLETTRRVMEAHGVIFRPTTSLSRRD